MDLTQEQQKALLSVTGNSETEIPDYQRPVIKSWSLNRGFVTVQYRGVEDTYQVLTDGAGERHFLGYGKRWNISTLESLGGQEA